MIITYHIQQPYRKLFMENNVPYFSTIGTRIVEAEQLKDVVEYNPNCAPVLDQIDYFNNLPFPVYIGTRDGVKYRLEPQRDPNKPQELYITRRVTVQRNNTTIMLPDASVNLKQEATCRAFQDGLVKSESEYPGFGVVRYTITTQYSINAAEVKEYKTLYLDNIDVLVSIDTPTVWHHPHSSAGRQREHMATRSIGDVNDQKQWGMNLEIVAPPGYTPDKYINLNGMVYRVPVYSSLSKTPGVYFSYNGLTTDTLSPSTPVVLHYSFERLDEMPIKIFNTYHEAMFEGNLEESRKRELAELVHANAQMKNDYERLKMERDQAQADREELRSQQKIVQDTIADMLAKRDKASEEVHKEIQRELELERLRYKHELEMKQMDRKDVSEWVRWTPTIIGGILALAAFFMKTAQK